MIKPETYDADQAGPAQSDISRMVKIGLCALIYTIGFFTLIWVENTPSGSLDAGLEIVLLLGSAIAIVAITVLWAKAIGMSGGTDEPVAESTRKSRRTLIISGVFGGLWSIVFFISLAVSGADLSEITLFSNSPLPPILAIGSAVIMVFGLTYASIQWNKNCDEHERAAVNSAMTLTIFFYMIGAPAWWLVQRSSLIPAQDPMIMYALVMIFFSAVWTYKRGE